MRKLIAAVLLFASIGLAQNKKIVAPGMSAKLAQEIQASVPNVTIVTGRGPDTAKEIADADAVIGGIRPELFRTAKKLKWVHVSSAGVEKDLFPELVDSEVVVTNAKNVYGPQIADHAFAFLLALTRKLNQTIPLQGQEEWRSGREGMFELNGKTAVIIGVGGIGSQIAQRAHGFGMKVIGVDPRDIPPNNEINRVVPPDQLDSVIPLADVVFISAPHTPKSEGMMGAKEFELMKKGSYFIAVSRGKVYNTGGLVKALDEGRIAGAGLDVVDPEPLPKGHPLWKFKNVVITPHTAGGSDNLNARNDALIKENVRRFASGQTLTNVVNKKEGF
jgi:D-2-hydroxyacid dehydrogenase (NADP+)